MGRVQALERDFEAVRLDWLDTLGKLTKIGNKMAAQQRRDLAHSAGEQLVDIAPPAPAPPQDRASRKAALRRSINGGNHNAG